MVSVKIWWLWLRVCIWNSRKRKQRVPVRISGDILPVSSSLTWSMWCLVWVVVMYMLRMSTEPPVRLKAWIRYLSWATMPMPAPIASLPIQVRMIRPIFRLLRLRVTLCITPSRLLTTVTPMAVSIMTAIQNRQPTTGLSGVVSMCMNSISRHSQDLPMRRQRSRRYRWPSRRHPMVEWRCVMWSLTTMLIMIRVVTSWEPKMQILFSWLTTYPTSWTRLSAVGIIICWAMVTRLSLWIRPISLLRIVRLTKPNTRRERWCWNQIIQH